MVYRGPERRSRQDRRKSDRRHHERRQYDRPSQGEGRPFHEVVPGRRKKADRSTGVDRRKGERRQSVRRDSDVQSVENKLELKNGMYYLHERVAGLSDGPYCTRCFDLERKMVPVEENIDQSKKFVSWVCPRCGAIY